MNGAQYPGCEVDGTLRIENASDELVAKLNEPAFGSDTVLNFCTDSSIVRPPSGPDGVKVYPNPVQGAFRIQVIGEAGTYRLSIYDTRGRRILQKEIRMKKGYMDRRVVLPHVRSGGIYLLKLQGPSRDYLKKLFIDR
jgi:hypothetical protein